MGKYCRFYVDIVAAHEEVTGSCNLVIVKIPGGETIRFVIDCGLYQEKEYDELNSTLPFEAENIDFCLVTHAHVDHIGRLPYMVRNGYSKPIYTTVTTSKLLQPALTDSLKVLSTIAKRKNAKPLYSETDVFKTLTLIKPCKYNETIQINENVKATFLMNGHLVGAALILVQISCYGYEDINLLFTGDYNKKNIFFEVSKIPEWILGLPLTIIQESTYGNTNSNEICKTFEENIKKYLACGNATVVIPVFALGRCQEVLYVLKKMQENGDLDVKIPIYLDGNLAIKYTNLYIKDGLDIKPEMRDFLPKNLKFVDVTNREKVLEDTNKKIILSTSGMGTFGPAQMYIPEYVARGNCLIQFTGYTTKGTVGSRLKEAPMNGMIEIGGILTKKRANVEYTTEFSAHAKADEMIEFLQQFYNIKLVLVNHGEIETKNIFAERILNEVETKKVGILGRKYLFRVTPYGLAKTLATHIEQ